MSLSVFVQSASSLPNVDRFSKSDPMCVITLQEEKKKTKVKDNSLDPKWNEELRWTLPAALSTLEVLKVEVYDHESVGRNRLLGTLGLSLRDVILKGEQNVSNALRSEEGAVMQSKINLKLTYSAPAGAGSQWRGGGEGDEDEARGERDVVGGMEGGGKVGVSKGGKEQGGLGVRMEGGADPGRHHYFHQKVPASRTKLPNKPLDFQVRMHFLEARKLIGGALNPVVKVVCGKEIKQTSTQKGTNNPFWDEVLYFNFKERPDEMCDKIVDIKVLDAKRFISDALIGSFKFDLGMVYDEAGHCYIHKWLLLTDPSDAALAARGYLKFSIQILGPGDVPKSSPSEMSSDVVDIEANLLRPSGVRLMAATMHIRIFRGQDFPQMDPENVKNLLHVSTVQKELVDPYCTVAFAGHSGSTQVIWKERDPVWNHQINLGVRFPSMCERLCFQVKDKDKLNPDDFVGTCYLNMSQISPPGDRGYLPTFGPCFINIYGSPREFSDLPDKYDHLNKGLIEGVSYRGRVMVEVETSLGILPTRNHEEIKLADRNKVKPFLSLQKYKLYGAFFSATMVYPVDAAVQFEVSIGNYGNKLDTTTPAQSSTTPPTNPVYDGNKYYFLPWLDQKPCTMVDSWWQDCTFRIESHNILTFTAEALEKELKAVKVTDMQDIAVKERFGEVLDNFLENLGQHLPKLPEAFTRLDKRMREYRKQELKFLREDAKHLCLNMKDYELKDMFSKCEEYIQRLRSLAIEPQNCIPDVIIWMLSGNKRVACKRIPSHLLMYSTLGKARGKLCGKVQTIFLTPPAVQKEEELEGLKDGAQVRLMLWLGPALPEHSSRWSDGVPGGALTVFAEIYENEAYMLGKWGKVGLTRPHLSDSHGKIEIKEPKEAIEAPPGWRWDGDWDTSLLPIVTYEPDEGLDEWTEDVLENQVRLLPLLSWPGKNKSYWTDIRGNKLKDLKGKELTRDDIKAPDGWLWKTDWEIDKNRVVNEKGWEYSFEGGPWVPYERNFHLYRRRRWVRVRERDKDSKSIGKPQRKQMKSEAWEYAHLPNLTYHSTEHHLDFARRKRWLRKLVATDPSKPLKPAIFHFKGKKEKKKEDEEDDEMKQQVPRMYLTFKETHTYVYQLRVYLYQARDMYGGDKSGLSDPYAVLAFSSKSTCSRVVRKTVCPMWDQILVINKLRFFGDPQNIEESPPPIIIEFFDEDTIGQHEYIGKAEMFPTVRLSLDTPAPRLDWHNIERYTKYAGELLAASELLPEEGGDVPFIPYAFIRPIIQKTRIEVLCWGLRDMKRYQLLKVSSPLVELECGGTVIQSKPIEDASKDSNFPHHIITMDVNLPKEELYAPPLTIRILDKRSFRYLPMVGTHIIKSLKDQRFHVDPVHWRAAVQAMVKRATPTPTHTHTSLTAVRDGEVAVALEGSESAVNPDPDSKKISDFDWWTKYYSAVAKKSSSLTVYSKELEKSFNHFTDLVQSFPLYRGKGSRDTEDSKAGEIVGYFKGSVNLYQPDDGSPEPLLMSLHIPSTDPISVIVRVYVVRGIGLQPRDPGGKSDPYLIVNIGREEINDKEHYIPNQLDPIFGKMFELPALLPTDHTLTITVMDWDRFSAHDLIGTTSIDIENRFLSQHRATCGLPESFFVRGPNKWRDRELPVHILEKWCKLKCIADPEWPSADHKEVVINGDTYTLNQFEKGKEPHPDMGCPQQRLALHFLRQQGLVPEHVETRNLFTPMQPGISQGQLHMWVDIFPNDGNIPDPIDISPRKPEKYVLQIVVWNTKDVVLNDESIISGEAMSDIYVKGWLLGEEETQKTDVHYRSLDGEGNFNWRFVFPFMYIPAEQVMVIKKKEHLYSLTTTEKRLSPHLTLQVWDNDCFTPDDFLGTLDLKLCAMPAPVSRASSCSLDQLPAETREGEKAGTVKLVDLFKKKKVKGWWPVYSQKKGVRERTGKLELEMEVVSEEEEQRRPAGKARDDPNMNPVLDPPNRPATSFLWFSSPWKTFKFIWHCYKWRVIWAIILILLVVIIVICIYSFPNSLVSSIINRIIPGS